MRAAAALAAAATDHLTACARYEEAAAALTEVRMFLSAGNDLTARDVEDLLRRREAHASAVMNAAADACQSKADEAL